MREEADPNPDDERDEGDLKESDPKEKPFLPENLDRTVIAIPLLKDLKREDTGKKAPEAHDVIIDLNLEYPGGRDGASEWVRMTIDELRENPPQWDQADKFIKEEAAVLRPENG